MSGDQTSLFNITVAMPNTRKKPHMSVTVVSSGPLATAGSTFIRFINSGIVPPIETATTVLTARATPTTNPKYGFPSKAIANIATKNPRIEPLIRPTDTSCPHTRNSSLGRTKPRESSRMLTATA